MYRSVMTKSAGRRRYRSTPIRPFAASITSCPTLSRAVRRRARIPGSSSMRRMDAITVPLYSDGRVIASNVDGSRRVSYSSEDVPRRRGKSSHDVTVAEVIAFLSLISHPFPDKDKRDNQPGEQKAKLG